MSRQPFASILLSHLTALLFVIPLLPSAVAQQGRYRHIDARAGVADTVQTQHGPGHIGPGRIGPGTIGPGNVGFGNFRTTGDVIYGQPGLVQQFGGTAISSSTYSYGFGNNRTVFGVVRAPTGVFHYSSGLVVPAIVPYDAWGYPGVYGYPGMIGYGAGVYGSGWGWPGYGVLAPGWSIDPNSGMAVSYTQWCAPTVPYFGGVNLYFPGSVLAPTLWSMNLAMRPSVPSTASYSIIDPRILDMVAPAPEMQIVPEPPQPGEQFIPDVPPVPVPDDGVPLLNEFEAFPRSDKVSTLAEKIHSLRYQATGDDAFRKEDYASAEVFYKSAVSMAPDRRAPYFRMAYAQIALGDFPKAVSFLKAGALMSDDATRTWVSAEELYGSRVAERARSHGGQLWNWLSQQPLSSDRLLLAGTFQKLRGFDKVASELLSMASHEGQEETLVTAINNIATSDIGTRAISHELDQLTQEASTAKPVMESSNSPKEVVSKPRSSGDRMLEDDATENDGIFLRGKRATTVSEGNSRSVRLSPEEGPMPLTISE